MILLDTGMRKMPDKCSVCNFFRVESQMYCTAVVGYTTVSKPYERRPEWCPLYEVTDSDTISRRQAIDALFEILDRPKHAEFLYTDEIAKVLNQLPPSPSINPDSDTISRPHWIRMPMFDHGFTGDYCFQCSECKALTQEFRDHCSKCGADMRP